MSGQNYIGSKISLISLSDIRYVGVLHNINSAESTVALQNVQSFGTEGRKSNITEEIGPSDNIFDYVVFRGSDIKDLQVFEAPPFYKPEPVIQQNMSTPIPSANNYYYNQQHYTPYASYGNYWQNTPMQPSLVNYQKSLDSSTYLNHQQEEKTVVPSLSPLSSAPIAQIPVTAEPIVIVESKLISTEKQEVSNVIEDENMIVDSLVKQVSDLDIKTTNVSNKVLNKKEKQKSLDSGTMMKASRSATRSTSTRRPSTTIRNSSSTTTRNTASNSTTATTTAAAAARNQSVSTRNQSSSARNQPSSTRKSSSSNTRAPPTTLTRDTPSTTRNHSYSNHDTRNQTKPIHDTSSTRNQSNSNRHASSSTTTRNSRHRSHGPLRTDIHRSDFDFVSANAKFDKTELVTGVNSSQPDDTLVDPDHFYNKKKSFFDDISCESKETNKGRGKYQEERKLNLETFGQTTEVQKRQRHRGRGGKGRNNQREKKIPTTTTTTTGEVVDTLNETEPSLLTELK